MTHKTSSQSMPQSAYAGSVAPRTVGAVVVAVSLGTIVLGVLAALAIGAPGGNGVAGELTLRLAVPVAVGLAGALCAGLVALPLARRAWVRRANRVFIEQVFIEDIEAAFEPPAAVPAAVQALDVAWSDAQLD